MQTQFWQNQARSQVLKFGGQNTFSGEKDFNIYRMFETNFF